MEAAAHFAFAARPERTSVLHQLGVIGRRFNAVDLPEHDRDMLLACKSQATEHFPGHELTPVGAPFTTPKFVIAGWACLSRHLPDGRRQIVDLFLPGDLIAYCSLAKAKSKGSYNCLTHVRWADAGKMMELAAAGRLSRDLTATLRGMEDECQARLVDNVLRNGRMLSHERLAHFILDLHRRHERVKLATGGSFPMPLTQDVLADILGMSAVHVNRTLQALRREEILKTSIGRWQILNMERLTAYASGKHGRHEHPGLS